MTWTIDPHKHRHDERSYYRRKGQPYYGHRLRAVLAAPEPRPSLPYRVTEFYCRHTWPAVAMLVLGCALLGMAIVAATWQVR